MDRSSRPEVFCKKSVLRNFAKFTGKHLCQSLFFNKVAGRPATLLKKTLAQVFSCEFCEISKNTFFYRTPPVAASGWKFTCKIILSDEDSLRKLVIDFFTLPHRKSNLISYRL